MSANGIEWDREAVRAFFRNNESGRTFLEDCARRGRNPNGNATTVDSLVDAGWNRASAIEVLRQLANYRCGEFVIGRRGACSRLEWRFSAIDVGKDAISANMDQPHEAMNDTAHSANAALVDAAPAEVEYVQQVVRLRPDATVTVIVPIDQTREEAERLAEIVKNIWFAPVLN